MILSKYLDGLREASLEQLFASIRIGPSTLRKMSRKAAQLEERVRELESLQDRIFTWGRETFGPGQRSGGVFAHLKREIKELGKSLPGIDPDELADCAILLFELAGFAGVDLLKEAEKKFKINQGRKWGPIQDDGSILHIEEEALGGE